MSLRVYNLQTQSFFCMRLNFRAVEIVLVKYFFVAGQSCRNLLCNNKSEVSKTLQYTASSCKAVQKNFCVVQKGLTCLFFWLFYLLHFCTPAGTRSSNLATINSKACYYYPLGTALLVYFSLQFTQYLTQRVGCFWLARFSVT